MQIFRRICSAVITLGALVSPSYADPVFTDNQPVMAIVIDDIGDNRKKGLAAINLPGAITYAFLPHTPHSYDLAEIAYKQGKEVILHAPMQNKAGLRLGPGALTEQLSRQEIQQVLHNSLDSIPHVVGMNNHMGSLLTENRQKMKEIMAVAKQRNIFFIDSVTTGRSVAWKVAHEHQIPYLVRDVFLDNKQNWNYIHNQFKQALSLAVTQGHAVVIGHPYPATVEYLSEALPILEQLGIRLVSASELLNIRSRTQLLMAQPKVEPCDRSEGHCQALPVAVKH